MKILTLNLHCFAEDNIPINQQRIVNEILRYDMDVIFLQEVAQTKTSPFVSEGIRQDNYGLTLQTLLQEKGQNYDYYYMFGNIAFHNLEEGLGILSKTPLKQRNHYFASKKMDYYDWHTRVIVSATTVYKGTEFLLTSVHLGWTEGEELFEDQLDVVLNNQQGNYILAGDFNVAPTSKEYQYIVDSGVTDLYYNNDQQHFFTATHISDMDVHSGENRIDYIFSNKPYKILERKILFQENRVSDHYGVYLKIEVE